MIEKPQLILDTGGVLVTNLSPLFWQELSMSATNSSGILIANSSSKYENRYGLEKLMKKNFGVGF